MALTNDLDEDGDDKKGAFEVASARGDEQLIGLGSRCNDVDVMMISGQREEGKRGREED